MPVRSDYTRSDQQYDLFFSNLKKHHEFMKEQFNETVFDENLSQSEWDELARNVICLEEVRNHELPCPVFKYIKKHGTGVKQNRSNSPCLPHLV